MRVVVVGATGNIGWALLRALAEEPAVDSILGVARRLPAVASFPCLVEGCVFDEGSPDALGRHWLSVHRF